MKNIWVLLIFLLCCSGMCKKVSVVEREYRIKVVNNSTTNVAALLSHQYPDTTIPANHERLGGVLPMDYRYFDSEEPWEEVFEDLPKDTLSIFFFSVDTFQRYDWQRIRNEYNILKRYDLSLSDLQRNTYTISYP